MRKLSLTLTLLTTISMVGCRFPGGLPTLNQPGLGTIEGTAVRQPAPPFAGRVTFAQRSALTSMTDVASGATVSLINTGTNQTVSTALTNANGEFVLNFSNGYVADPTATYFLEAVKGMNANQAGNHAVRVRTIAKYSTGWTSITSATPGSGTVISPSTTALSIGAGLVNGNPNPFNFSSLVGSLTGGATGAYQAVSGLSADEHTAILGLVETILADGQDPVANVGMTRDDGQTHWTRLNVAPVITAFTPAQAMVAASVTVSGSGFSPIAASNILKFNGEAAVPTSASTTGLTTNVPAGATSGPTSLQVGNLSVLGPNFSVLPTISDFAPKQGEPGTLVTLTGTGFDGKVRTNNLVEFDGVAGTITEAKATSLKVLVPAGAGNGRITVTVNGQPVTTTDTYLAVSVIRTVAGTWAPKSTLAADWQAPYQTMAFDADGNLYTAASALNLVFKISTSGILTTVAGNGITGFDGDGGPATAAKLNNPQGVAVDAQGNLYIADTDNHCIRKVTNGVITTVAGNGASGFSGNGGPATSAKLYYPQGVAVDATGNLYIADTNNQRIRKVTNGTISTVAGNGSYGYDGDDKAATSARLAYPRGVAVDASDNLYIADTNNGRIRKVSNGTIATVAGRPASSGALAGGNALSIALGAPSAVAEAKNGDLYIADSNNDVVWKLSQGNLSVVDTGTEELSYPLGVAEAKNGDLYIADSGNNRVLKVTSDGTTSVVEIDGMYQPNAVAVDKDDALYVSSGDSKKVIKVEGETITTVYTDDNKRPRGVAVDATGNLYLAIANEPQVLKVSLDGTVTVVAGTGGYGYSGDGGLATYARIGKSNGLAVDASGNLYIADRENSVIRKVDLKTGLISTVVGNGMDGYSGDGGAPAKAQLDEPQGLAMGASGTLYIADTDNRVVRSIGF
ncbi:IPT/TIG domain-containing protein [bacterium]|nr:IPT/TIG domain-containing protein [bacterium]